MNIFRRSRSERTVANIAIAIHKFSDYRDNTDEIIEVINNYTMAFIKSNIRHPSGPLGRVIGESAKVLIMLEKVDQFDNGRSWLSSRKFRLWKGYLKGLLSQTANQYGPEVIIRAQQLVAEQRSPLRVALPSYGLIGGVVALVGFASITAATGPVAVLLPMVGGSAAASFEMIRRDSRNRYQVRMSNIHSYVREIEQEFAADCMADLSGGIRLNCGHEFHADCLRGWVAQNNSCPMCRGQIQGITTISESNEDCCICLEPVGDS